MKLAAASPVECIAETAAPITTAVPSLRGTVHFVSSRRPNAVSSAIRENKIASRMEHVTRTGEYWVMAGNLIAAIPR